MPSKTEKQHDAMEAAAHGDSKLGIPKKVGQEFVAADAGKTINGKKPADHKVDARGSRIMRYLDGEEK